MAVLALTERAEPVVHAVRTIALFYPTLGALEKMWKLWERMSTGKFSNAMDSQLFKFNGRLFAAARADWREVETARVAQKRFLGSLGPTALDCSNGLRRYLRFVAVP